MDYTRGNSDMAEHVFVVDASALSYNLRQGNYAASGHSQILYIASAAILRPAYGGFTLSSFRARILV